MEIDSNNNKDDHYYSINNAEVESETLCQEQQGAEGSLIKSKVPGHRNGRDPSWPKSVEFHPSLVRIHSPPRPWSEWTLDDFEIGKPLGNGAFGHVYLARTTKTKFIVALKVIHMQKIAQEKFWDQINREAGIHVQLEHPNIVNMYGCFQDQTKSVFVLEYCPGGEVYQHLMSQPDCRYNSETAATYILQVAEALEYLHSLNIIHRDIKPENLLIGYSSEIKLSDFGWSIQTHDKREKSKKRLTICGTIDYLPPEMINKRSLGYDKSADLWCLGVLCFEFLVGKPPFESPDESETKKQIIGSEIAFPDPSLVPIDEEAKCLLRKMLQKDPAKRPTLSEIKQDEWIMKNKSMEGKLLPIFEKYKHLNTSALKEVYVNS